MTARAAAIVGRAVEPRGGRGTRRRSGRGEAPTEVEVAVLLDLLDAACVAGSSITSALAVVGESAGGARGAALTHAAGALGLGAPWGEAWAGTARADAAWVGGSGTGGARVGGAGIATDGELAPVRDALRPSWVDGVAPGGTLRAVAGALRRERRARAMEAAGRLGVRLVVPLAVCHLPAFVLVGLVPVLISMASGGAT